MTEIIAIFKLKDSEDLTKAALSLLGGKIKDLLEEIAEKNEMDLISWGTI